MVVNVSVVYPGDPLADWELRAAHCRYPAWRESIPLRIATGMVKTQNLKSSFY